MDYFWFNLYFIATWILIIGATFAIIKLLNEIKDNAKSDTKDLRLFSVRHSAFIWWNNLNKSQQLDIEFKTYGERSECEDNTLTGNDIVHMYNRHYT